MFFDVKLDAEEVTSIHSSAGQRTSSVPAGKSGRLSGGGGDIISGVLIPSHRLEEANCLPPLRHGLSNQQAVSDQGTEGDAESSCGSTQVVRSQSPLLGQEMTGGVRGVVPEGSNDFVSDARKRWVYEEAEQLQQVLGNLKLEEEGLRDGTWQGVDKRSVVEMGTGSKFLDGGDQEGVQAVISEEGREAVEEVEKKVGEEEEKAALVVEEDSGDGGDVGGQVMRRRSRGSIERKGSITWYDSTVFKDKNGESGDTSGMGVVSEKGEGVVGKDVVEVSKEERVMGDGTEGGGKEGDNMSPDNGGGDQLIEKRILQIEEKAKRRRDEEWKVELAKLVAEDQELKKLNARLETEKRRLEEAVGLGGVGEGGPPGRKWEVEREVMRVRLWEVEQELSGLKVHAAGVRAEGEALRRKLDVAEAAVRSGEQGTQV